MKPKSTLEQLRRWTKVVADTGDVSLIKELKPTDTTTNPSLILSAARSDQYSDLLEQTKRDMHQEPLNKKLDYLLMLFTRTIQGVIHGRVSTEVDARLSFDTAATVERARSLIQLYKKNKVDTDRILIKVASTWEGIQAIRILEAEGIHCNATLLFSDVQAVACAEAGATLISPFVGRILDWYKKNGNYKEGVDEDPGVVSVRTIYNYYKHFGYKTEIMGASFRDVGEILSLAGCDLLTISPKFLMMLQESTTEVTEKLSEKRAKTETIEKRSYSESEFRFGLNQNAMATEKLAEGIRNFVQDSIWLERLLEN